MNDQNKPSKFGLGLVFGTILGGLAAFFLSPKSGKENREALVKRVHELKETLEEMEIDKKVREVWGEVSVEGRKIYKQAQKELLVKLDELHEKWDDLDREKYVKMVEEVLEDLRKETPKAADKLVKLKDSFVKDWNEVMSEKKPSKKNK